VFTYPYCKHAEHPVKVFIVGPKFSEDGRQILSAEKYWCSFRSYCAEEQHEHECAYAEHPTGPEDPLEPCLTFPLDVSDLVMADMVEQEA
jgi:hypothetical protein